MQTVKEAPKKALKKVVVNQTNPPIVIAKLAVFHSRCERVCVSASGNILGFILLTQSPRFH